MNAAFWTRVAVTPGCWLWQGAVQSNGYGNAVVDGRNELAHRAAYTALVGEVPEGLVLDHLCRVRLCVNPSHLEPVTQRVNTLRGDSLSAQRARQTHCRHGHELTEANTYRKPNGCRNCRTCRQLADHRRVRAAV